MSAVPVPTTGVLVKLASLAVHVQEAVSGSGHELDLAVAGALAESSDVVEWLDSVPDVLLPEKR